jgi:hypothetical protein
MLEKTNNTGKTGYVLANGSSRKSEKVTKNSKSETVSE